MRPHLLTPARAAALTLLLGVGLSACSLSDPATDPATGSAGGPAPTRSAQDAATELPAVGPLDDYLGIGTVAVGTDEALSLRIEEEIARCMAAEGFEYVPHVDTGFEASVTADGSIMMKPADFPDLPPDEFAAQFGYGLSTRQLGAERSTARPDPNEAIVARMSVAERVAYHHAYYGQEIALDREGRLAGTSISTSEDSCSGRAYALEPTDQERAATERRMTRVQESFESLLDRVRDLREEQDRDPRMAAATSAWAGCLAAAGHRGFTALDEPRARARADAEELLGPDLAGTAGADATRLAALRAAEIELAVADQECLVDWQESHHVVERDLEERFVRENLTELEAFRSAMSAARP